MNMGYPIITDGNFNRLGMIDNYISFIWTSRYYTAGDFEIYTAVDAKSSSLLTVGNYVIREDDPDNVGIIEAIETDVSEDRAYTIIAKGRFLPAILGRRIIADQTQVLGLVSDGIYSLIEDAITAPIIEARKIDNFIIDRSYTSAESMDAQYTGKNLLETIAALCENYKIGQNVTLDENNNFVFKLYEGIDRSYAQNVNSWVIFSDRFDNLLSSMYVEDRAGRVTSVLVAGEGEGVDRKTLWVTDDPTTHTGLERYELYADSRQIRSNDGEITDEEYYAELEAEGRSELTEYSSAFTGRVDFRNIKYRRDVFLGDVCTVENTKMHMYINARLVEVIESMAADGKYEIIPTFGL